MALTESVKNDNLFTITPIVAWRRWIVSTRRPWEEGSGLVLRGAWGRAWTTSRVTARCLGPPVRSDVMGGLLDTLETGRHQTPVPEPDCTCGVYAEKTDSPDLTRNPRLAGRPAVAGFVELSGRVLEGTRGYRAREGIIIGPLELEVPCAGGASEDIEWCPDRATTILTRGDDTRGACDKHISVSDSDQSELAVWVEAVVAQLEATYNTPILHINRESQWTSVK